MTPGDTPASCPTLRGQDEFLTIAEIAGRTGLPPATVARYLDRYCPGDGSMDTELYPPEIVEDIAAIHRIKTAGPVTRHERIIAAYLTLNDRVHQVNELLAEIHERLESC